MLGKVDTTGQRTRNLILIGFMGTGKTTIGKQVAKSLGLEFVDTDALIARKAGKSIPDIFEEDGEKVFRRFETEVLRECVGKTDQVISTGGGIVTQPENSPLLEEGGYVVWLRAEAETIFERVRRNKHRPLLQVDDPLGTIRGLLEIRDPLYEQAQNLSIRTDELTMDETCYGVTETARLMLGLE